MTAPLLSAKGLAISFGGIVAASGIDLDVLDNILLTKLVSKGGTTSYWPG